MASPPEVLDAIKANGREWRESAVPPELRREGVLQVEVRVRPPAFTMNYVRSRYPAEGGAGVQLRGRVTADSSGGSLIVAEAVRARTVLIGAGVLAAIGVVFMVTGGRGGGILIAVAAAIAVLAVLRDRSHSGDDEDRYLITRLEQAIAAAESAAAARRAQSV